MIHVAIVDDEKETRRHLVSCLNYMGEKENVQFNVTEFPSGTAFLGGYRPEYDIVLMDIEMPGMNGMETARALRKMDATVILIFITNLAQYAVNGYEVEAMNYLLKPINKYDFAMKMARAVSRTTKRLEDSVQIRTDGDSYMVRTSDIKYLDVSGHYVNYHTTVGNYTEYSTLKEAEKKINKDFFVRCNRCYLVNLRYVTHVKGDSVFIEEDELEISRPQKKQFLSVLASFLGGVG